MLFILTYGGDKAIVSNLRTLRNQLLNVPLVRRSYTGYLNYRIHRNADVFIVSFPKSGRTWLRVMVGKVLSEKFSRPFTVELEKLADENVPYIRMIHDGSNAVAQPLETDKRKYKNKGVVFLARDPRDTVVSYYFHLAKRDRRFSGDIADFIRDERFGIERIIDFMNI